MTRFHELDALRAVAMLLGVVLHALLFLVPDPAEHWPVQDVWVAGTADETNPYVHLFLLIHGFRMPLFFLISGFFTAMLWQARGSRPLAMHRIKRVALPLALGALTIIPATAWLISAMEREVHSDFSLLDWPVAWLETLYHLWFLWYLLLIGAIFLIAVRLGLKFLSAVWWVLIPVAFLSKFFMEEEIVGPDLVAAMVVIPDVNVLAFYASFFFFGVFFHQRRFVLRRWWTFALIPAVAVTYPGALIFIESEPQSLRWAATSAFQIAYAWLMCFGMMGLFHCIASRERTWVRYMADASYWIYLTHVPLVLVAQWLVVGVAMSVHLKFVLVCVSATALTLVVYHLGVRYTWIGTMLNGRRVRPA